MRIRHSLFIQLKGELFKNLDTFGIWTRLSSKKRICRGKTEFDRMVVLLGGLMTKSNEAENKENCSENGR
jgi:hypothetical protein